MKKANIIYTTITSPEILVNKLPIAPGKKPDTIITIPPNNADIGTKEAVSGENSNHFIKFSEGKGKFYIRGY